MIKLSETAINKEFIKMPELKLSYVEENHIRNIMDNYADGNKTIAAKILGIDRRTLYRKLGAMLYEPKNSN